MLTKSFQYVQFEMGMSHRRIVAEATVLRYPRAFLRCRHEFLRKLTRHQYEPAKPNFVSLSALVRGSDAEFAAKVAKVPVSVYNRFLKTLVE